MGCFTFTLANRKLRVVHEGTPYRDYAGQCKLGYGNPAYVLCPDGLVISESCYEGYGVFGGHDIYDLVVDWNREHLVETLKRKGTPAGIYYELAEAIQDGREADCPDIVQRAVDEGDVARYMLTDWKRSLGVEISCGTEAYLPYPIKISDKSHPRKSYKDLPASIMCQ